MALEGEEYSSGDGEPSPRQRGGWNRGTQVFLGMIVGLTLFVLFVAGCYYLSPGFMAIALMAAFVIPPIVMMWIRYLRTKRPPKYSQQVEPPPEDNPYS